MAFLTFCNKIILKRGKESFSFRTPPPPPLLAMLHCCWSTFVGNSKHLNFEWMGGGRNVDCFVLWSYPIWGKCLNNFVVDCSYTPVMACFCNLITKWVNIHLGPGVKYAGFPLFFVVVGFLSLKAYYFKFDKTTEPWGRFFSWRHFGMDHQCISLAFSPRHIWIYWIRLNTVSLIDITVQFFYYLHWDLWNTHCNPAEQKLKRMTSITLLPTYFCVTVKSGAPFSGFRYNCIPREL